MKVGINKTFDSLHTDYKAKDFPLRYWRTRSKTAPNKNGTRNTFCRLGW